jgi:hypothetical protein
MSPVGKPSVLVDAIVVSPGEIGSNPGTEGMGHRCIAMLSPQVIAKYHI